jgi:excisionase family DNA binding protein
MENDILTTTQTAKLLGVSVRTAQLLIEGGSLTSWKTPGGHRRVYRSDVLTLMARRSLAPAVHSARVVLLSSVERLGTFKAILDAVSGSSVEAYTNAYATSFSIGALAPAVVVVDVEQETAERISLLRYLASDPAVSRTKLIAVGAPASIYPDLIASRLHAGVASPQELADVVRTALLDEPAEPLADLPSFPVAENERQRLAALMRSGLLDAGPEERFDQLTWLASRSLKAPIALVTLLTSQHQHFKSRQGIEIAETPRSWAFCNYTILQREVFSVGDLIRDARFASNPAVVSNDLQFRFYAGTPVIDPDGFALGSLCVIDTKPRALDGDQEQILRILGKVASDEIRLRGLNRSRPDRPGS